MTRFWICSVKVSQGFKKVCETRALDKYLVKNTRKKAQQVNIVELFLLDTLKLYFEWRIWNFQNQNTFFNFQNRQWKSPLSPLVAPLWVWRNMYQYPWKCLNKPFRICQGSEYAWSSDMFDRLLKKSWVLNMPWLRICHGCIWKDYVTFRICLIMAPYTSIIPEYA